MKFFGKLQIYFVLFFAVCLWSCELKQQQSECGTLPYCGSMLGPEYYYEEGSISYYLPTFNPSNSSEIAYLRVYRADGSTPYATFEKYNIISGQKAFVFSNQDLQTNLLDVGRFDWAQNDWIVFENYNNSQLHKVKSDGSQLAQLTFDGFSNFPSFNFSGNKILYSNYSATYGYYCLVQMDIETNVGIDTLINFNYHRLGAIQNDMLITSRSDDTVRIIDENSMLVANKFYPNYPTPSPNIIWGIQNISSDTNEIMVLSGFHGIFRLNLVTKNLQLIKASCENLKIESFSISNDGTKIVYELAIFDTPNDPCHIRQRSEIHIMNIDGSNDQVLNLP
jgi:hypothetical protein